jgi:peptide/nickel transport system permease protein
MFPRNPGPRAGAVLLAIILLLSAAAPWLTPYSPEAQGATALTRHLPPSAQHLFGTDQFGRDVFTRVLFGGRISLAIGLLAVALSISLGALYGAVSGYLGGVADTLLMRCVDVLLAFPLIFFSVTAIALFGSSLTALILILGLTGWMDVARLVRAEVLSLKERAFILKARAAGLPQSRVILRHLLPNTFAVVAAASALRVADIILLESALSFLGMGVQPPTASWGAILNDGRPVLAAAWWLTLFPGLAIALTTISFHLIAEALPAQEKKS